MNTMEYIKEGQKVEIRFKISSADEIKLLCSVKEIHHDRIMLNFSEDALTFIDYLQEGYDVIMKIYTPFGIKVFYTIIIDSPDSGAFVVEFGGNYDELQRRKYIRATTETKLILRRPKVEPIITKTIVISSGSVRFYYEGTLKNKEPFECFLYLPNNIHSVKANGIIVRAEHLGKNEHLFMFTKIQDSDVAKINRKCIELNSAVEILT